MHPRLGDRCNYYALETYTLKHPNPLTCSHGEPQRVRGTEPVTLVSKDPSLREHTWCSAEKPGTAVRKAWLSFPVLLLATWSLHPASTHFITHKRRDPVFSRSPSCPVLLSASLAKKTNTHTQNTCLLTEILDSVIIT